MRLYEESANFTGPANRLSFLASFVEPLLYARDSHSPLDLPVPRHSRSFILTASLICRSAQKVLSIASPSSLSAVTSQRQVYEWGNELSNNLLLREGNLQVTHLNVKPVREDSANDLESLQDKAVFSDDFSFGVEGLLIHGHVHVPELEDIFCKN